MQELETIFWERNQDITQLKQQDKQMKKQDFQQRQRVRVQKQNWILKVIKTIKTLTNENKKNIFESVKRMMSYYREGLNIPDIIDYDKSFTEELINLFVNFYSQIGISDISVIKKIVRPNNAFIAIDLVKQLVETHRQFFKVKLLQTYKEGPKIVQDNKSKPKLFPVIMSRREIPTTQPSQTEESKRQPLSNQDGYQVHDKVKQALFQKWQNYVNYGFPTQLALKTKMNDAYCQLLERNQNNRFIISKFQQRCYGKSRNIGFCVTGLYTQEQIRKMEQKIKYDVRQKFSSIKQLKGDPSAEQLKQYFKIKTQIQDGFDKLQSKKQKTAVVNSWVPIITSRSISQEFPIQIYIILGKDQIILEQFIEKCGISLKNYLKLIVKDRMQQFNANIQENELKNFKRHHFIDLNHAKKKQLMTDQHRVYSKDKKQSIFPMLRSNELRQQKQIALKNRSLSEHKLSPVFKNDMINKKLECQQGEPLQGSISSIQILRAQHLAKLSLKQSVNEKIKWSQQKYTAKSKIDNIISLILNQRNLTLAT